MWRNTVATILEKSVIRQQLQWDPVWQRVYKFWLLCLVHRWKWANTIIKKVKIKIIPWKLLSFTSRAVFQQLTGCKFCNGFHQFRSLLSFAYRQRPREPKTWRTPLRCVKRVTKFIVTICRLRKRQWQVKERRQIQEMTPEKYYPVHLVSSVLPLTAKTNFLPQCNGNDTGNLNRKSLTCKWPVIWFPCKPL